LVFVFNDLCEVVQHVLEVTLDCVSSAIVWNEGPVLTAQRPRILAIDDAPINLKMLEAALAGECDVQTASSGELGLELAARTPPDLILLDVMMPGLDGFATFERLRQDPRLCNIPVIFVTALNDSASEMKGLALGAADYLAKPIKVGVARQRIHNLLERERLRKEVQGHRDALQEQARERLQAQQEIASSLSLTSATLESTNDAILVVGTDGRWILNNQRFIQLWSISEEVAAARDDQAAIDSVLPQLLNPQAFLAKVRDLYSTPEAASFDLVQFLDGKVVERYSIPQRVNGQVVGRVWSFRDVTQRVESERKLHLAASVFTHAREAILITAADGTIVDVNEAFEHITGYSSAEVLGNNPRLLSSGRHDKQFYAALWRNLREKGYWFGEIWNRRKNGEPYVAMQTISAVTNEEGQVQHYVSLFSDITASKEHQSQLERIAHYDALTKLPNRVLLADRMQQAQAQTQRRGQCMGVAFLDLDGFKVVNDRHGHEAGDQMLVELAQRMKQALREGDTLARLGGDEFVALLVDLPDASACEPMVTRLLNAASTPVLVGEHSLSVSASVGLAFFPQAEPVTADQLLRQADQAMYQAKLAGKNRFHVFDSEQDRSVRGHHESLDRIRRALRDHEFVLYYQPKVNLSDGNVIGVEALIRWQHPELGLLAPSAFLPVVEDHPMAIEIGEWVIETALQQMVTWQSLNIDLAVSVNVGAKQLQQSDFVGRLQQILLRYPGLPKHCLEIEILETNALEDVTWVAQVIQACQAIGVSFALDDFGTGYSSLTYLKRLPVSVLKIDQSFVRDMLDDSDDLAILEGVTGLAVAFRRQVIAEGVETVEHGTMLLQLGCELAQGYGIARPMPASQLVHWMASWRPYAAWAATSVVRRDDRPLLFAGVEMRTWIRALDAYVKGQRKLAPAMDRQHNHLSIWLASNPPGAASANARRSQIESLFWRIHEEARQIMELMPRAELRRCEQLLGNVHTLWADLSAQMQSSMRSV
jgi:diguanylate cyclase (GGDEF)-like protein/PAS domain S-box-containing protein